MALKSKTAKQKAGIYMRPVLERALAEKNVKKTAASARVHGCTGHRCAQDIKLSAMAAKGVVDSTLADLMGQY